MISAHAGGAAAGDREADLDRAGWATTPVAGLVRGTTSNCAVVPRDHVGDGLADLRGENIHEVWFGNESRHEQHLAQRHAGLGARLERIGERALGDEARLHEDHAELLVAAVRARPDDLAVLDDEAAREAAALERDRRR